MGKCEDLGGWSAGFFSDKLRISGAEEMTGSKEWVLDAESVELLAVLEVFGVENMAVGFQGQRLQSGSRTRKGRSAGTNEEPPSKARAKIERPRVDQESWTRTARPRSRTCEGRSDGRRGSETPARPES